jgi:malate synthase
MEDAATAEISRAQVWQWVRHKAPLSDGTIVTKERLHTIIDEELAKVAAAVGEKRYATGQWKHARDLFEKLSTADKFEEFLTLPAYEMLIATEN